MMRLIDADALITAQLYDEEHEEFVEKRMTIEEYIDAYTNEGCPTTVEPTWKWISVKDRLPKSMANKVLVWLKHNDLIGYIGFGHYEIYKGQEIWLDLVHSEAFSVRGYTVTHWMPLPEPPKMERSENND